MVPRDFWLKRIKKAWERKPIIWLSGVRRAGKTFLSQSTGDVEYFDCELPRTRKIMDDDPEAFLDSVKGKKIILDEVHKLKDPSELLKIAADHYKNTKVLATGSSILEASKKFKDTLTNRKVEIWLTPMTINDLEDFKETKKLSVNDIKHRFLHGGLPPFFIEKEIPESDFQEWIDSFWSKDIQELFSVDKRYSFQKFTELLMVYSGGIFEANKFAGPCEVSRTTINNYLKILEATFVAHVIKPFNKRLSVEIVSAPKVYGFDTGFICFYRGWLSLRPTDLGDMWEHFVLNELQANYQKQQIKYWRDKKGHEVDFVINKRGREEPIAIECKWSAKDFDSKNLSKFRHYYPNGESYVVANDINRKYTKKYGDYAVTFVSLKQLIGELTSSQP